ncbi:MAG: hypothetical protein NVSMB2_10950 [Chloroflexota bacterium]
MSSPDPQRRPLVGRIDAERVVVAGSIDTINLDDRSFDVGGRPNPYLGLQAFSYATRERYAGRERQVAEAMDLLTTPGTERVVLFVTGASGSGKSSFAQAGLVPQLEHYYAQRGHLKWALFRPSRQPLVGLARALADLELPDLTRSEDLSAISGADAFNRFVRENCPDEQMNIIVLDQLEEIFTQSLASQRDAVLDIFAGAAEFRVLHTHLIAAIRADYLPSLFEREKLFGVLKQQSIELRAMTHAELTAAIQRPLQEQNTRLGGDKRWQPELVDRLAQDAASDVTFLPLLQVTLESIWNRGKLRLENYGTLGDALQERAEDVYLHTPRGESRSADEQARIVSILLDLVRVSLDDDPRHDVRFSVPKSDLSRGDPQRLALIDELIGARLLSTRADQLGTARVEMVDVIHETLLTRWDRLRQAIVNQRELLQQRERFRIALQDWKEHSRADGYVLQGVMLALGEFLAASGDVALSDPDAQELVRLSTARAAQARRRAELTRLGVVAAMLIIAITAAIVSFAQRQVALTASTAAEQQAHIAEEQRRDAALQRDNAVVAQATAVAARDRAERQARIATSQQLAAQASHELTSRPDIAFLLNVEANAVENTFEARSGLYSNLLANPRLVALLPGQDNAVSRTVFTRDGKTLATGDDNGSVVVWDTASRRPLYPALKAVSGPLYSLAVSPDGSVLAAGGKYGELSFWNLRTGQPIGQTITDVPSGHWGWVNDLAFSPDGSLLASASLSGSIFLWDAQSHDLSAELASGFDGQANAVAFSPDGKTLAAGGFGQTGNIVFWDIPSRREIARLSQPGYVWSVAFNADARQFLSQGTSVTTTGLDTGTAIVWDLGTGRPIDPPLTIPGSRATSFSGDGKRLVSVSKSGISLIDVESRQQRDVLEGFAAGTSSAFFSPDDQTLVTAKETQVALWDVGSEIPGAHRLPAQSGIVQSMAFNQAGTMIASGTQSGQIDVYDAVTRLPVGAPMLSPAGAACFLAFGHTDASLASASPQSVLLWDLSRRVSRMLPLAQSVAPSVAFSTRGLVAAGPDGVAIWDTSHNTSVSLAAAANTAAAKTPPSTPECPRTARDRTTALSADGLLTASAEIGPSDTSPTTITITDVGGGQTVRTLNADHFVPVLAFSRDGRFLAAGGTQLGNLPIPTFWLYVWDVSSGALAAQPMRVGSPIEALSFSADARVLATGHTNGTLILWDMATGQPLGPTLATGGIAVSGVEFSPTRDVLLSRHVNDTSLVEWDVADETQRARACAIANRNLTRAEWKQYRGTEDEYHATCPNFPIPDDATASG